MNQPVDLSQAVEQIRAARAALAVTLAPSLEAIRAVAVAVLAPIRAEYARQGSPYGDSDGGFLLWLEELSGRDAGSPGG